MTNLKHLAAILGEMARLSPYDYRAPRDKTKRVPATSEDKKAVAKAEEKRVRKSVKLIGAKLYKDGNAWGILRGKDLQIGDCAFGPTPQEALSAFLKAYPI